MSPKALWFCIILFAIGSGAAADVPFVFGENSSDVAGYTSDQLKRMSASSHELKGVPIITSPLDTEVISISETGGGSDSGNSVKRTVGEFRELFDEKVDLNNPNLRKKAVIIAKSSSGDRTIDQICKIYDYMKKGDGSTKEWSYLSDPREGDYFQSASETLSYGEEGDPKCVGAGDCDDFAILMSALLESIGGTTRIILAHNNSTGGHAYTEIYLGNSSEQGNQVEEIIAWVKQKYITDKIYTHIDTDTKDVWLNLDWGAENRSGIQLYHPGGPFFQGDRHIVIRIRESARKTFLRVPEGYKNIEPKQKPAVPENQPPVIVNLVSDKSSPQAAETIITWTAQASDHENDPIRYMFILNGQPVTEWQSQKQWTWTTTEANVGENQIEVRVRDEKHAGPEEYDGNKVESFTINEFTSLPVVKTENGPPALNSFTADKASPQEAGATVSWKAEASDPESDPILYRFFVNGTPCSDWQPVNLWAWTTTEPGTSQIEVQVMDGKHAGPDRCDANKVASFTMNGPHSAPHVSANRANSSAKIDSSERTDVGIYHSAQKYVATWQKTIGDFTSNSISIDETEDYGYIVTGTRIGGDILLLKINYNGSIEWEKRFGGPGFDEGNFVRQTRDSGYLVTGTKSANGNYDVWLIKTDSEGNIEWEKTFGGSEMDTGNFGSETHEGGYIISGKTESLDSKGNGDIWLIKLNELGNEAWNRTFGTSYQDIGNAVYETKDGGYVISGDMGGLLRLIKIDSSGNYEWEMNYEEVTAFPPTSLNADSGYIEASRIYSSRSDEGLLVRIAANGSELWRKTFDGRDHGMGRSAQSSDDGGFVITGVKGGTMDDDNGYYGKGDVWLLKTNFRGEKEWEKTFGGHKADIGEAIIQTNDRGFLIAAYSESYEDGRGSLLLIKTNQDGELT